MTNPILDIRQEIERRSNLLVKCSSSLELQQIQVEMCRRDIHYFFDNFLYTDKNKTIYWGDEFSIMPFIPYSFQREYINEVWDSIVEGNKPTFERKKGVLTNVFVEKSRQMWISWITAWIFVYWFLFHRHKYTIISRTADEVDKSWDMDSMFEKLRFMIRNLPDRMLPAWFNKAPWVDKTNSYMNISYPDGQASITGKTANKDAGRWGTRNAIFMDEMAFMQYAKEINKAAGSNSPCIIYNSTPNWTGNEFYRMRLKTVPQRQRDWTMTAPEIKGLRYHRRDHPLYNDEWYAWKTQGKTKEQIAQEYEIDYNTALVGRVYPDFPSDPSDFVKYDPEKPLFVWIDNSHGWTDPNAIILMQPNFHMRDIVDAVEVSSTPENCAEFLRWQPKHQLTDLESDFLQRYQTYNRQRATFISDPYDTMSALGNSTIYDDYRKRWINLSIPKNRKKSDHIQKTKTNMYRIRRWENCFDFANAIQNARFPTRPETSNATNEITNPVHDWTSHFRTALEYLVMYIVENPLIEKKEVIGLSDKPLHESWLRLNR